jgi:hypothetical protein
VSTNQLDEIDEVTADSILGLNKKTKKHQKDAASGKQQRFDARTRLALAAAGDSGNMPTPYRDVDRTLDKSASNSGLTFQQKKAIRYLVAFNYTDEMTAVEVGVSPDTIKKWRSSNDAFKRAINASENHLHISAMKQRVAVESELVGAIHDELMLRVHNGELQNLSFEKLAKLSTLLAHESRLDDPDSVTSRAKEEVDHTFTINQIKEKYNLSRISTVQKQKHAQLAAASNSQLNEWLVKNQTTQTIEVKVEKKDAT